MTEKDRARKAAWQLRNADRLLEKDRERRAANPDRIAAVKRAYYVANRERTLARQAAYRSAHLEQKRAADREYYQENRDRRMVYIRDWQRRNPERVQASRKSTRSRATGTRFTSAEWRDLLIEHGHRCRYCDTPDSVARLTADHAIPLSRGGSNLIENIVPACLSCNDRKGTKTEEEYVALILSRIQSEVSDLLEQSRAIRAHAREWFAPVQQQLIAK